MNYSAEEIARACGGERKNSNGWQCKCPAHKDGIASLSINEEGIFYCHAKCDFESIKSALVSHGITLSNAKPKPFTTDYIYEDENRRPYLKKVRFYPKDFRIHNFNNGTWVPGKGEKQEILYKLPDLRAAVAAKKRVAIAEGEKDANRIFDESKGEVICTTNITGGSSWRDEFFKEFIGADVTIFYDNDKPDPKRPNRFTGRERKDLLVTGLTRIAKKITIIHLPLEYKDISDFWDAGQEISAEMREVLYVPSFGDFVKNASDWLYEPIKEPDEVIKGVINSGDKTVIIGKSKTRKSFFSLQFLISIAAGVDFLGFQVPRARKCLLIQYEIKPDNFHIRLVNMACSLNISADKIGDNLKIANARGKDFDDSKIIEYAKDEGIELILFDPLYKIIDGDESDAEVVKLLLKRFDKMAEETKAAIIYVHHDKKGAAGEIASVDRGSGSSVLGRDYDSALLLTPHKDKTLIGLEVVARNHAPTEAQSIEWQQGCFVQNNSPFQAETSRDRIKDRNATGIEDWEQTALNLAEELGPTASTIFLQRLNEKKCPKGLTRPVVDYLIQINKLEIELIPNKRGRPTSLIKLATYTTNDVFNSL